MHKPSVQSSELSIIVNRYHAYCFVLTIEAHTMYITCSIHIQGVNSLVYGHNDTLHICLLCFPQAENNSSLQFLKEYETPEHDAVYNVYLKKLSYSASRSTVSYPLSLWWLLMEYNIMIEYFI